MTNQEKIRHLFRIAPETRFNRSEAYWKLLELFYGAKIYATKQQLLEFFKDWAGLERSLRNVIREPEFKLNPEADQKRYQLRDNFKKEYSQK